MKPYPVRNLSRPLSAVLTALSALLVFASDAGAQTDGTWNTTTSGLLWSTPANWTGNTIADGSGATAGFSQVDIPAGNTTVNLDSARTVGTLIFGDGNTSTAGYWILANNGNASNILTLAGNDTITVNAMSSSSATSPGATISAVISGSGGLVKNGTGTNSTFTTGSVNGTGTLMLSGANTYTGGTDIQTGAILAANALAFGGAAGGAVTVENGASLILNASIANTVNLNGIDALAVVGGSSVSLLGTVNLQSNSSVWVTNVRGNNALTFSSSGSLNLGNNTMSISTSGSSNTAVIAGTVTGGAASGITYAGGGPLTISGDNSGYSGTTTISGGSVLQLGSNTALGTGTLVIAPPNNGNLTIRSNTTTAQSIAVAISLPTSTNNGNSSGGFIFGSSNSSVNGNLTFTNTTDISLGGASRVFQVYNRTQFNAGFTGAGLGLTLQTATGTLVLNGINTYTGATTIKAGTLLVNGSLSTSSAVSVASGARIGGVGSVGNVTISASGAGLVYQLDSASQSAGLTATAFNAGVSVPITGLTVYLSGAATGFNQAQNYQWAVLTTNSTDISNLSLSAIALDTTGFGATYSGVFSLSEDSTHLFVNYAASAIPEPATYALIVGVGLFGFALWRKRRAA